MSSSLLCCFFVVALAQVVNGPNIPEKLMRCILHEAYQMKVSTTHSLEVKSVNASWKYFDSVCRELVKTKSVPVYYNLCFAVPADVYETFSKQEQSLANSKGVKVVDAALSSRVK